MDSLHIDQTSAGYHPLVIPDPNFNPARLMAEMVSTHCKGEIDISYQRIEEIADILWDYDFSLPKWDFSAGDIPLYPQFQDKEQLLKYFVVLSSINYEYFHLGHTDPKGEPLRFSDGILSGAELATSRITQNWEQLQDPKFLSELSYEYATKLFNADVPIPRLGNRVDCLRSVGSFFRALEGQGLSLADSFAEYNGDALAIARHLSDWVVGFNDEFLKRATLTCAMIAGRFQDREDNPLDPESFKNLTIIADYRVPQTLIGWGILEISDNLRAHLHNLGQIREDSLWGRGLRAASIVANDAFVEAVNARRRKDGSLPDVTAIHSDPVIWAIPRKYQKAIEKGDTETLEKLAAVFIEEKKVPFPQIPTIKF